MGVGRGVSGITLVSYGIGRNFHELVICRRTIHVHFLTQQVGEKMKFIKTIWDTLKGKLFVIQPVIEDIFRDDPALDYMIEKIINEVRKKTELNSCSKIIFVEVNDKDTKDTKEIDRKLTDIVSKKFFIQ